MSITHNEILQEAYRLSGNATCEIQIRNAISRGYYGVYHHALTLMDSIREVPPSNMSGSSHIKLSECFKNYHPKDTSKKSLFRRISIMLKDLHNHRCDADYELDIDISASRLEEFNGKKDIILGLIGSINDQNCEKKQAG